MPLRFPLVVAWITLAVTLIGTAILYPSLPSVIATHWDASGQVNGAMSALPGAFLVPLIMLIALLLLSAIPYIDPLRVNFVSFRREYDAFIALFMLFFAAVQGSLLAWNLGAPFNIGIVIAPAVGVLIFYLGMIMPRIKRNWFVGIRTPWTVSSDIVWQKTHQLGGRLFEILGVVIFLSVFWPSYAIGIIVIPLVIVVIGLVLYSYVLYEEYGVRK